MLINTRFAINLSMWNLSSSCFWPREGTFVHWTLNSKTLVSFCSYFTTQFQIAAERKYMQRYSSFSRVTQGSLTLSLRVLLVTCGVLLICHRCACVKPWDTPTTQNSSLGSALAHDNRQTTQIQTHEINTLWNEELFSFSACCSCGCHSSTFNEKMAFHV